MTMHWHSHKGFSDELRTASSAEELAATPEGKAALAELLLAMRKVPEVRVTSVNRAKKLMADPKYPSREVLRGVAEVLARHWDERGQD
jgi:hypothetical protein